MADARPGFFGTLAALVRAPIEERLLRLEEAKRERLQVAASSRILGEVARLVQPETDGFLPIVGADKRELDTASARSLLEQAQRAAQLNPHAVGYLGNLRRFVMGDGPSVTVELESEEVAAAAQAWLDTFHRWNAWDTLEDEIPTRGWRDGEVFLRFFDEPPERALDPAVAKVVAGAGSSLDELGTDLEMPPDGMIFLRLIPAEHVQDPSGVVTHGIVTAGGDVQTILGYCLAPAGAKVTEIIPAAQVLHVKLGVDADVKRGRSKLEVLLQRMQQFEDWLKYRITLNLARTAVVMVKTVAGSPGQIAGIRDQQQTERETVAGQDRRLKMLKPMTTIHASPGVSYDFKAPNIQATDAKEDGRAILLTMAAATGLPEFMFTGDASNANYSSTLVAQSPALREFKAEQDFWTPVFIAIHRRALVAGAAAGSIKGLTEAEAKVVPIKVEWPPLLVRDELPHTQANQARRTAGILSLEGMARDEGIDWDVERERLAAEAADPPARAPSLQELSTAVQSGLLTPDEPLEAHVRATFGLPAALAEEPGPADDDPALPPLPGDPANADPARSST